MEATKLQVKFFLESNVEFDLGRLVAVWHEWIRNQVLDELLIDVADYSHVHHGPAVLLVGHGSDYAMDFAAGQPGLLLSRKRDGSGDVSTRIEDALRRVLVACEKLESDASLGLRFRGDEVLLRVNDRLRAPNTDETLTGMRGALESVFDRLYAGAPFSIEREGTERELFTARVRSDGAPGARELLPRIA